jgi:UDP-glucose 4-epimerase
MRRLLGKDNSKALLVGGNGFIGSHLADALLERGWRVAILDRAMERYRKPLSRVEYLIGSYADDELLAKALQGVTTVFHLASTTLPKTSNDNPVYDIDSNVIGSVKLLEACVKMSVRKCVFLSTGGIIYGRPTVLPVNESHATDPDCSYGITKLAIEKYLALFNKLYGLDYVILRPSNPYGPRQDPLGAQGVIAVFLGKLLAGEPIEIWGDGSIVRDYVHVRDLAEGICAAAVRPTSSRIFNLGMGVGYSLRELCAHIETVVGRSLDVRYGPGRTFDVPTIVLDVSKAIAELGWAPTISLDVGIEETWEFIKGLKKPRLAEKRSGSTFLI